MDGEQFPEKEICYGLGGCAKFIYPTMPRKRMLLGTEYGLNKYLTNEICID